MATASNFNTEATEQSGIVRVAATTLVNFSLLGINGKGYIQVTCAVNEVRLNVNGVVPTATGANTAIIRTNVRLDRFYVDDLARVRAVGSAATSLGNIYWEKI